MVKKDAKSNDKKEGESKEGENENNGNEGEKFDEEPKYNDPKDIGDKMKNGSGESENKSDNGDKSDSDAGGGPREADTNNFNFGKDQANQMTASQISEALHNESLSTIAEASEEEEDAN